MQLSFGIQIADTDSMLQSITFFSLSGGKIVRD